MLKTARNRIFDRIRYKGKNWVFSAADFTKDFKRWEIDQTLRELEKESKVNYRPLKASGLKAAKEYAPKCGGFYHRLKH